MNDQITPETHVMNQKHKRFILENIRTLNEFSITSYRHLLRCAQEENNQDCAVYYQIMADETLKLQAFIHSVLKREKV